LSYIKYESFNDNDIFVFGLFMYNTIFEEENLLIVSLVHTIILTQLES